MGGVATVAFVLPGLSAQSRWIDRRLRGPRFWAWGLLGGSRSNLKVLRRSSLQASTSRGTCLTAA